MAHTVAKEWITEAGLEARVLYVGNSHNCGYVRVPDDHPWYEDDYDDHYSLDCHGGLTFAGRFKDADGWWFGFDAAHLGDATAYSHEPNDVYRDRKYMADECGKLAKQIKELV